MNIKKPELVDEATAGAKEAIICAAPVVSTLVRDIDVEPAGVFAVLLSKNLAFAEPPRRVEPEPAVPDALEDEHKRTVQQLSATVVIVSVVEVEVVVCVFELSGCADCFAPV